MKRKMTALFLSAALAFSLAACGDREQEQAKEQKQAQDEQAESGTAAGQDSNGQEESVPSAGPAQEDTADGTEGGRTLIAYFSVPEDVDTSGVDAIAGASIVVKDREVYGNTEYVAKIVQETTGGDLFRIETTEEYPLDHDPLVDQAAEEQDESARPELKDHIEDLGRYDTVILGFPNWWGDLPMPVYTFLEEYDLGGKTIIPFVTHGGSGLSGTEGAIAQLQPEAEVSGQALSLSREDVAGSEAEVRQWAESLR